MFRIKSRGLAVVATVAISLTLGIPAAHAADPTLTFGRNPGSQVFGLAPGVIAVTASVPGKVAFTADGVAISGCDAVATTEAAPFTASCTWTSPKAGNIPITAKLTPTDSTLTAITASGTASVGTPINQPGQNFKYERLGLYVDTVNASGSPAKTLAASLQSNSCVQMSQFARGMGIVFRVYVNDYLQNGIPLTNKDAKVSITIKGWDTPTVLSYGNHSGSAFWAAALTTGEPGSGKYNALGTIDYSVEVTLIEKPEVTKQVVETNYVAMKKNGKTVKVDGKVVYQPQKVTKTVVVTPAVMGEKFVYSPSRWATTSLLTLNA